MSIRGLLCVYDLYPEQSHIMLTGGQDNSIKVWNLIDYIDKKNHILDRSRSVYQYLYKI